MDFLATLHFDVKLLLVGGALALVAALFSGTKKQEFRYMAAFALLMAVAGVRYHQQSTQDSAEVARATDSAVSQMKSGSLVRASTKR